MINKKNLHRLQMWKKHSVDIFRDLSHGYDDAMLRDLRRIIAHVSAAQEWQILCCNIELGDVQINAILRLWKRYCGGEPLSKIFNRREFYKHIFYINQDVLDPRPESELIVENVIRHCHQSQQKCKILEVGVGSGAILLSILAELPESHGIGIDISEAALDVAKINAQKILGSQYPSRCLLMHHNIDTFSLSQIPQQWSMHADYACGVDVIVSNPPYIAWHERDNLDDNVLHYDPHESLFADDSGLAVYKKIAERSVYLAREGAMMFLEIAPWMVDCLQKIFARQHKILWPRHVYAFWMLENVYYDLSNHPRMLELRLFYS